MVRQHWMMSPNNPIIISSLFQMERHIHLPKQNDFSSYGLKLENIWFNERQFVSISSISDGGVAISSGLKVGDLVIGMNGMDIKYFSLDVIQQLMERSKIEVELRIFENPNVLEIGKRRKYSGEDDTGNVDTREVSLAEYKMERERGTIEDCDSDYDIDSPQTSCKCCHIRLESAEMLIQHEATFQHKEIQADYDLEKSTNIYVQTKCFVCKVQCLNEYMFKCHLKGKRHKSYLCSNVGNNIDESMQFAVPQRVESYRCSLCLVEMNSLYEVSDHEKTESHIQKCRESMTWICRVCNVYEWDEMLFKNHIYGKQHAENVDKYHTLSSDIYISFSKGSEIQKNETCIVKNDAHRHCRLCQQSYEQDVTYEQHFNKFDHSHFCKQKGRVYHKVKHFQNLFCVVCGTYAYEPTVALHEENIRHKSNFISKGFNLCDMLLFCAYCVSYEGKFHTKHQYDEKHIDRKVDALCKEAIYRNIDKDFTLMQIRCEGCQENLEGIHRYRLHLKSFEHRLKCSPDSLHPLEADVVLKAKKKTNYREKQNSLSEEGKNSAVRLYEKKRKKNTFCEICLKEFYNHHNYFTHLRSKAHLKKSLVSKLPDTVENKGESKVNTQFEENQDRKRKIEEYHPRNKPHAMFPCKFCHMSFGSAENLLLHKSTVAHKQVLAEYVLANSYDNKSKSRLKCLVCDVRTQSKDSFREHLSGQLHLHNVERLKIEESLKSAVPQSDVKLTVNEHKRKIPQIEEQNSDKYCKSSSLTYYDASTQNKSSTHSSYQPKKNYFANHGHSYQFYDTQSNPISYYDYSTNHPNPPYSVPHMKDVPSYQNWNNTNTHSKDKSTNHQYPSSPYINNVPSAQNWNNTNAQYKKEPSKHEEAHIAWL